jgi:hypothetical protein
MEGSGASAYESAQRYEQARPLTGPHRRQETRVDIAPGHPIRGNPTAGRPRRDEHPDGRANDDDGWELVHITTDDCTRLADTEVRLDEKPPRSWHSCDAPSRSSLATPSLSTSCSPTKDPGGRSAMHAIAYVAGAAIANKSRVSGVSRSARLLDQLVRPALPPGSPAHDDARHPKTGQDPAQSGNESLQSAWSKKTRPYRSCLGQHASRVTW